MTISHVTKALQRSLQPPAPRRQVTKLINRELNVTVEKTIRAHGLKDYQLPIHPMTGISSSLPGNMQVYIAGYGSAATRTSDSGYTRLTETNG